MTDTITPLGKARVMSCPECKGARMSACPACRGEGKLLVRACPLCGDLGWDYVNGIDDREGMACRDQLRLHLDRSRPRLARSGFAKGPCQ